MLRKHLKAELDQINIAERIVQCCKSDDNVATFAELFPFSHRQRNKHLDFEKCLSACLGCCLGCDPSNSTCTANSAGKINAPLIYRLLVDNFERVDESYDSLLRCFYRCKCEFMATTVLTAYLDLPDQYVYRDMRGPGKMVIKFQRLHGLSKDKMTKVHYLAIMKSMQGLYVAASSIDNVKLAVQAFEHGVPSMVTDLITQSNHSSPMLDYIHDVSRTLPSKNLFNFLRDAKFARLTRPGFSIKFNPWVFAELLSVKLNQDLPPGSDDDDDDDDGDTLVRSDDYLESMSSKIASAILDLSNIVYVERFVFNCRIVCDIASPAHTVKFTAFLNELFDTVANSKGSNATNVSIEWLRSFPSRYSAAMTTLHSCLPKDLAHLVLKYVVGDN